MRSGYSEDYDDPRQLVMWRGVIASALRGRRGQKFLHDLIYALDNMTVKELIQGSLVNKDGVCALGVVGAKRGLFIEDVDPENHEELSALFDIAKQMVQEVEYINDEASLYTESPAERWRRVRLWAVSNLRVPKGE